MISASSAPPRTPRVIFLAEDAKEQRTRRDYSTPSAFTVSKPWLCEWSLQVCINW